MHRYSLELDLKCPQCGYESTVDWDPDIPVKCQKCNRSVVIEDYSLLMD